MLKCGGGGLVGRCVVEMVVYVVEAEEMVGVVMMDLGGWGGGCI